MVRCHLESPVVVWFPYKMKDIEEVESVQKRATKMLPETKNLSYEERLRLLNLPTIVYRRHRGDMIELYKMTNDLYDNDVFPKLEFRNANITINRSIRDNSKQLFIKITKKEVRKNFFTQRVSPMWNALPEKVVSAPSINCYV